jgi:uncharacterized protein (TIGR02246 family)
MKSTIAAALTASLCLAFAAPAVQAAPGDPVSVQELADREAIRDVLLEYGRSFDERRLEDYANLFADNGEWIGGPTVAKGPAEVLEMVKRTVAELPTAPGARNFHVMTNMMVDVDGDTATAWSRYTFYMPGADGQPDPVVTGVYDDKLIKVGGKWKFLSRKLTADMAVKRAQQ